MDSRQPIFDSWFFFTVFSAFRFLINIAIVERPILVGYIFGAIFGHLEQSLIVACVFELLWLDVFAAGTVIPPNAIASTVAALALIDMFSLQQPAMISVAMLLAMPLAYLFSRVESAHRDASNKDFDQLQAWVENLPGALTPARLIMFSMARVAFINGLFFIVALAVLSIALFFVLDEASAALKGNSMTAETLVLISTCGAMLGLRYKPAYVVLCVCFFFVWGALAWA